MTKAENRNIYYELVNRIIAKGEARPKRHGQYIKLQVYDNYYLELDTWNKSIYVYNGGNYKGSLGIDFGGFKCDIVMTRFWLAHIPNINK